MEFPTVVVLLLVALVEIQGKNLEPGPQVLNDSAKHPPQTSHKRYATKEIILYLTPSQIRALQEGQGLISAQNVPHADLTERHQQAPLLSAIPDYDHYVHPKVEHVSPVPVPPVEEHHSDHFVPATPPPEYQNFDNYAYFNFQPHVQPHTPKPIPFFHEHREKALSEELQQKALPTLIPHEKLNENQFYRDQLKQQWYRLLDQNRAQLKALSSVSPHHLEQPPKNEFKLQYAPNYNDQKYALEVEQALKNHHLNQVEKQRAALQAEAIANLPPVVVHKEINIKHIPGPLIKHVKVPVPTPVLIPVPEPFEVKVPQPYPVPLEIIKRVPYPVYQTQKVEVEKPVPYEVEKHIPVPITKSVYVNVDRPYFVDRIVPVPYPSHKTESSQIHRHEWKN